MPLPRARCRGGKHTAVWLFAESGRSAQFLKLSASLFLILSNLAGPGERGRSGRAHARRPPLSLRDISPAPRGNLPQTPAGPSFSYGRKGCKRPFRGSLWTPPKDPRRIPPISALYQVRTSRPSLRRLVRANCARSSAALWNFVPTLGLSGSSGSEMPTHFRKSARLRRAQRAALCAALLGIHRGEHLAVRP